MCKSLIVPLMLLALLRGVAAGQDYQVKPFEGAPPEGFSEEIAAAISESGYKIVDGDKVICEIWPAKQWQVVDGFTSSLSVLYPFEPGCLTGVLRFPRRNTDFRDQDVGRGLYTLRYAKQPEDGNHVGTFDTRDFFVMVPAEEDTSTEPLSDDDLFPKSAESAGSSHPAIMPLLKVAADAEAPGMRHLEEPDWWTVRFGNKTSAGKDLVVELIVAGHSLE
jgi:hypothetical protein